MTLRRHSLQPHRRSSDTRAPTQDDYKQRLRLRRFLLASAFSVLYLAILVIFYSHGKLDGTTLVEACALVLAIMTAFLAAFRSGANLRFADPSLTAPQFLAAVFTMLFVVYRAPDTRLAFSAFFFVALMFGMLRSSSTQLAGLGLVSLASFGLIIWFRFAIDGDLQVARLDMLQLIVIATTFPWLLFIGGRIKRLQRNLHEASIKLEDIEERARHDDLTGVYNRRALMAAMEDSKRQSDESREPLSICVIDLDLFKRYNDEFDHLTGDQVLRQFAQAAGEGLRSTDIFGRYGGEEFVQVMPRTTLAGAMLDADRLCARIRSLDLPMTRSVGALTVSIGVAQYRPGEAILQTFARADEALYKAKQRGRNRVES